MTEFFREYLGSPEVTEIIVNGFEHAWIEREGSLSAVTSPFGSVFDLTNWVHQICADLDSTVDLARPRLDGRWGKHRVNIIMPPLSPQIQVTLRRLENQTWSLGLLE